MQELIDYISRFDPAFAGSVRGASRDEVRELSGMSGHVLPADYSDFLLTMGNDCGHLSLFDGEADFRLAAVRNFYARGGRRPPRDAIFIGADHSGGGANYFLESLSPEQPMHVVRFPDEDDGFPPILVHPGFANMLFTLGFLTLRLHRLHRQAELLADEQRPWIGAQGGSRLDVLQETAHAAGLARVPHTGSWSIAFNGDDSGIVYYEVPTFSPTVSVGTSTDGALDALTARLSDALRLVRVR
jgi:hypothetical protein